MDAMQLRFLTTQALYGKDLEERSTAMHQLQQGELSLSDGESIGVRLELALNCQDEFARSAAAMLLDGLAERIAVSPELAASLLALSRSPQAFSRQAALRAIKSVCERGRCSSPADAQLLGERLEEARRSEGGVRPQPVRGTMMGHRRGSP